MLRNLVWPVYGALAGFSIALVGLAGAHGEPIAALVVAGVAALLRGHPTALAHREGPHPHPCPHPCPATPYRDRTRT